MKRFSMTFSQNNKQAKILMEVDAENLADAVAIVNKSFNVTTLHKCYELKEDNSEKA